MGDNSGRILVLGVAIDATAYFLINLWILNQAVKDFRESIEVTKRFSGYKQKKNHFWIGLYFIYFFYQKLESASGKPILKKLVISKLIELKQALNLCDIGRIRNPKSKTFTFR